MEQRQALKSSVIVENLCLLARKRNMIKSLARSCFVMQIQDLLLLMTNDVYNFNKTIFSQLMNTQ